MRPLARLVIIAVAYAIAAANVHAGGIDATYSKPEERKVWGELLAEFVGYEGFSKSYALIVGISEYKKGYRSLPTANDPLRVRDFLLQEAGFDYVHVLTEEKATYVRIRELMVDFFPGELDENDRFLFYWSGHGEQRRAGGRRFGYLPLADSPMGRYHTMVGMDDIQRWDTLLNAQQALFLLDACFSGLAGSATMSADRNLRIDTLAKSSHHVITAGTAEEQTIAGDRWGGSIFTDTILRAVRGAADTSGVDFGSDGVVSLAELFEYAGRRIASERSRAGWTRAITPQLRDLRASDGQFFFLTNEHKVAKLQEKGAEHQGGFAHGMPVVVMGGPKGSPMPCDVEADRLFWDSIKNESEAAYFEAYLDQVKSRTLCGLFGELARLKLAAAQATAVRQEPETIEVEMTPSRIRQVQEMLAALGFDPGSTEGRLDPKTRAAIAGFQFSTKAKVTGTLTVADEIALALAYADRVSPVRRHPTSPSSIELVVGRYSSNEAGDTFKDCVDCPEMVILAGGTFLRGSPEAEPGRYRHEGPQHEVKVPAFVMGKYEVTRVEYAAFVKATGHESEGCYVWEHEWKFEETADWQSPGFAQGERHPVTCVSWQDAKAYATWLSKETDQAYRLPSEAEWEYAARAGTVTPYLWGDDANAGCDHANGADATAKAEGQDWVSDCNDGYLVTASVGSFRVNDFNLLDMSGNVWEWVEDCWHDSYDGAPNDGSPWTEGDCSVRAVRGGSWYDQPEDLRLASRGGNEFNSRSSYGGFRVATGLSD